MQHPAKEEDFLDDLPMSIGVSRSTALIISFADGFRQCRSGGGQFVLVSYTKAVLSVKRTTDSRGQKYNNAENDQITSHASPLVGRA